MSRRPTNLGHDELTPLILGQPNGADAVLVEGTGLFLAVRKGDQRWVTGDAVRRGLTTGSLVRVHTGRERAMTADEIAATVPPDTAPEPVVPAPPDVQVTALTPVGKAPVKKAAPRKAAAKRAAARKR